MDHASSLNRIGVLHHPLPIGEVKSPVPHRRECDGPCACPQVIIDQKTARMIIALPADNALRQWMPDGSDRDDAGFVARMTPSTGRVFGRHAMRITYDSFEERGGGYALGEIAAIELFSGDRFMPEDVHDPVPQTGRRPTRHPLFFFRLPKLFLSKRHFRGNPFPDRIELWQKAQTFVSKCSQKTLNFPKSLKKSFGYNKLHLGESGHRFFTLLFGV